MAELHAAFERVVTASGFILGEEVERFEAEYAAYCGTGACVGVASGTAALELSLIAAGIGRGDEVIVPGHTYIATALSVRHCGATPVFCDVEEGTGLIDPEAAAEAVSARTAAMIPVHLYGQMCEMDSLTHLADRHGLLLVEDAAQAHGATYSGSRAGAFGAAACFSFYPSKNLGALGDAGAICTNDSGIAARARQLRHLGQRHKGEHLIAGRNERLDGLQAALLRVKLPHLDRWNARRRELAALYRELLADDVRLLEERPQSPCVYHLFPIRLGRRDAVLRRLAGDGIACGVHYHPAAHEQPPFVARSASRRSGSLDRASEWACEQLSLPLYPELRSEEAERIAERCAVAARAASHPASTASAVTR
ncbi:MAG: DegT/DnrJ/EryC1/StrS family aminotransferase [Solirubrobacterales bacterium]|nr:DegT/DnrJ/EryC1/StrS family aminotransferase [Solirubrobacterales bacterium]